MKLHSMGLFCASLLLPALLFAEKPSSIDLSLRIESFRITHVGQQRIDGEMTFSMMTDQNARIERVDFANLHANGVPFFAQPLVAPIDVHRGESLLLPPVSVAVYPADLDSLKPLLAIVEDRLARLQAEVSMRVRVTPLQHLFLGNGHPLVVASIDQSVEVTPPGGILGRASAIALLRAAQIALGAVDRMPLRPAHGDTAWGAQLSNAQTGLYHLRTCYSAGQKKQVPEVCVDGLAVSLGPHAVVSAAELGTPWRFDPVRARALADQGGHLETGDARITVQALASAALDDVADAEGKPSVAAIFRQVGSPLEVKEIVLPGHSQVSVYARNSPGVYGQFRLDTALGTGTVLQVAPDLHQSSWDELAVFRLIHTEEGAWTAQTVFLSGTSDGQAITFSRPVDHSTLGSPILTPQGLIGVVQSEAGGTLLADGPM